MRYLPLFAVLLAGCALPLGSDGPPAEPPAGDLTLRTDQSAYVAEQESRGDRPRYGFVLLARFENRTTQRVYLPRCYPNSPHPIFSVELVDSENEDGAAYNGNWACVGHGNPIILEPGATRTDTLHIIGPNAWPDGSSEPFGELEGRFRLAYRVQSCRAEAGCELPESPVRSNDFMISLGR